MEKYLEINDMNEAFIIAAYRSPVGKAPRGGLRTVRPDDLAADVIRHLMQSLPGLDKERIEDVIVGNATPEAEQGLNIGRMISLLSLDTERVPGMTVNRYCASGLEAIAIATAKIRSGMADCILAGGVESMSCIPFGGWRITPNYELAKAHPDYYWGMGLTAEAVAREYRVSREDQDVFALQSHQRAIQAIDRGFFRDEIVPIRVWRTQVTPQLEKTTNEYICDTDEGPRRDTSMEKLAGLKPVFDRHGSVTAGNASQTSDGAAFVMLVSEKMLNELNIPPIGRLLSYRVAGLSPRIMGMGPVEAVPTALAAAGKELKDMDLIELNEAFAAQSLAVMRALDMDPDKVNVNGGAIALGHPLGCSGAKLSVQLFGELKRRGGKYGLVTMCVGTGQGAAGVFEQLS